MSHLVFTDNDRVVTDSLIVAETFGKRHADVKRDIRNLDCSANFNASNFARIDYKDGRGRLQEKFLITQDGFSFLVMGYTGKQAAYFKELYIKEFNRMKKQLQPPMDSYMISDPVARAERWIQEQKKIQEAERRAAQYEEKADYVDRILQSPGAITITQIAKDYGLSAVRLNQILKDEGVQFKRRDQWLLTARFAGKGYTKSQTTVIKRSDGREDARMHTVWTQKGRLFIHEIMKKHGYAASVEKKLLEA